MNPRFLSVLVRLWRLGALALAIVLLHGQATRSLPQNTRIQLSDALAFFPSATVLVPLENGAVAARDAHAQTLGTLVTTSPQADGIKGYAGPSNLLVALDTSDKIVGTRVLESADTPAHVEILQRRAAFTDSLKGWNPAVQPPPKIEGVGGSTLTGLGIVEAIALRLGGRHGSLRFPEPLTLPEVRSLFPSATAISVDVPRTGWCKIADSAGALLGYVVRTSPASDSVAGYAGPTECLVAIAPDAQTIREVRVRKSYDTEEYVERVVGDGDYLKSLTQWRVEDWPALDFHAQKIEGVAGATQTSFAVAEGLRQRFRVDTAASVLATARTFGVKDWALWLVLCGSGVMAFTELRGKRGWRLGWQAVVIGCLGLWLGEFVSVGLLVGWARQGIPWKEASPLVVFVGAALLVPWGSRRQLYCHHVCPHGAAQEWVGRLSRGNFQLSPGWHRVLRVVPGCLLAAAFGCALRVPKFALGNLEPFDFWVLGSAAAIPAMLAAAGLVGAAFIPMAYCRYGCPTGALLGFMRATSSRERFGVKDAAALVVLSLGTLSVTASAPMPIALAAPTTLEELRGTSFGTTWCVKVRGCTVDRVQLHDELAVEVERIEATLSHWRPDSATSRFNANPSLEAQVVPQELGHLVQFALRLSRASAGAYDITVAPLVAAWGYGPLGEIATAPSDAVLAQLLEGVGWQKLEVSEDGSRLRKKHPSVALDLGSILQGYAADRMAGILNARGCSDYLIEVGGELLARGAWRVAIENPADAQTPLLTLELKDAALATSGLARARRRFEGQVASHIISPRTGRPVDPNIEACSIQRPTCLDADGWSTAVIASGLPAALEMARREGLIGWVLDAAGRVKRL